MSDNKKYYWLKLKEDFFTQPQIKKLRRIAGGDTYTIIYQKIMLLSIKNGGLIEFQNIESCLAGELSLILDEELDNVKMVLAFMESSNLIEKLDNENFLIPSVVDLIGSHTDAAERMKKMRERNIVTPLLHDVTQREERREKTEELEKKEKSNKTAKAVFDYSGFLDNEVLAIKDWLQYKQERGQSYKLTGLKGLRTTLLDLKTKGQLVTSIQKSISSNWSGLFEDKIMTQVANKTQSKLHRANSQNFTDEVF